MAYNSMQVLMGALSVMGVLTTSLMFLGSLAYVGVTKAQARPFGDGDIEALLERLNKPTTKSFTLKDGDIVDCVDIYKQLAFDHPLLKNHKIQMLPSFVPERNKINVPHVQPLWLESEACPDGTVPVRKVQKNDIIRVASTGGFGIRDTNDGQTERAGMYMLDDGPHNGARASINLWRPFVEENEWSHANIEISDKKNKNFIEGGWLVHHQLFGDEKTRLYTYWTADGYVKSGCYNTLCPGFVQVSTKYVLGAQLVPMSVADGAQYFVEITMYKDLENQNWWLVMGDEPIGYWPREIFSDKSWEGWKVQMAGTVLNMNNKGNHTTTQMGSGAHADLGYKLAASFADVGVAKRDRNFDSPDVGLLKSFSDNDKCYDAIINERKTNGNLLYYGGNCS